VTPVRGSKIGKTLGEIKRKKLKASSAMTVMDLAIFGRIPIIGSSKKNH
jgi:hypothetical protein